MFCNNEYHELLCGTHEWIHIRSHIVVCFLNHLLIAARSYHGREHNSVVWQLRPSGSTICLVSAGYLGRYATIFKEVPIASNRNRICHHFHCATRPLYNLLEQLPSPTRGTNASAREITPGFDYLVTRACICVCHISWSRVSIDSERWITSECRTMRIDEAGRISKDPKRVRGSYFLGKT